MGVHTCIHKINQNKKINTLLKLKNKQKLPKELYKFQTCTSYLRSIKLESLRMGPRYQYFKKKKILQVIPVCS